MNILVRVGDHMGHFGIWFSVSMLVPHRRIQEQAEVCAMCQVEMKQTCENVGGSECPTWFDTKSAKCILKASSLVHDACVYLLHEGFNQEWCSLKLIVLRPQKGTCFTSRGPFLWHLNFFEKITDQKWSHVWQTAQKKCKFQHPEAEMQDRNVWHQQRVF